MSTVSLEAFGRAVAALQRAVRQYSEHAHDDLRVMARDALILNFELCYGQCGPVLQRCLADFDGMDGTTLDTMTLATLIRTANERGYLETTWAEWKEFRDARNIAVHAYSEPAAERIAARVPQFLRAVEQMLERMRRKQAEA